MREIKFRAWDKENRVMFYSEDNQNDDFTFISEKRGLQFYYIDKSDRYLQDTNSVLMQYSGFKDKCGREIYEGDVCKYEDGEHSFIAIVEPDYVNWYLKGISPKDNFNIVGFHDCGKSWLEIIGNIYENPELLEGETNDQKSSKEGTS